MHMPCLTGFRKEEEEEAIQRFLLFSLIDKLYLTICRWSGKQLTLLFLRLLAGFDFEGYGYIV